MSVFQPWLDWFQLDEHGYAVDKVRALVGRWDFYDHAEPWPPCLYDKKQPWTWCVLNGNQMKRGTATTLGEAREDCVNAAGELFSEAQMEDFMWHGFRTPEHLQDRVEDTL